jgi:uncharacterized iron-regulated membrane protein
LFRSREHAGEDAEKSAPMVGIVAGLGVDTMTAWRRWVRRPQTLFLRKALFQVHLWTGIGVGLYILVICLTGSVIVYRNELYRYFSPQQGGPLPLGFRVTAWLLDLHDNLLAGQTGRHVNGVGAGLLLLLCLTGALIWWPGVRTWRRSLKVERRAGWRRLAWTLHSAIGFWCFGFVVLWGITGAYLSLPTEFGVAFDYIQPFDEANPERLVDKIQYWLAYLHFGRLGGRGIPGCGRPLCDETTKAIWATVGLALPLLFLTGAFMWWTRVVRPFREGATLSSIGGSQR